MWYCLWHIVGILSFIFWWTAKFDLTLSDMILALFAGTLGPLAFPLGYFLHGDYENKEIIIFRKRKK